MDLHELRIFSRVAALASFTQAAQQLGLTKSRVSSAVQRLEVQLGTRLLQRTTRQVRLTSDGVQFLARCEELLADAEQLQGMFQPAASGLRGRLRIDLPNVFARDVIIPRLPAFLAAHPLLEVGISTSDHRVDPVLEGFDCVLRVGPLGATELVARPLGRLQMCNLASPAYLAAHGTPHSLQDLAHHRLVHFAGKLSLRGAGWEYEEGGKTQLHPMPSALIVNGTDAYQAACLAGLGLIQAPRRGAQHLLDQGRLVEVLPAFTPAPMAVSLLYPHRRQLPARVAACLDWLAGVVTPHLAAR
ncbi:LysR family transcriptional regulator [Comamonas endophytica]|uniref:LysR family transcriptional regulator n=1 Tax=Comamonas endophytica TaxID=2949090 RepID=A0ABY6GF66_9BURK|nr:MULTISPECIES: LysR family transcriptional regulator [unclassified Acidovorax]MCD2514442.1 LysR family transcriptional regulator [Acidovorax sp. D4N7]UYG53731.1 LysR family transcriptional regulator [Acidovorax sp. 5MLIR]